MDKLIRNTAALGFALLFNAAVAQKPAAEKPFSYKIDGTIRNFTGKTIYLHHRADEKSITDSAKVKDGKFTFSLKEKEAAMHWFTVDNDVNSQVNVAFFADGAPVKATLIADTLYNSTIEAGQAQKDYLEYRNMISSLVQQQQKMQADYNTASQNNDNATMSAIQAEFQNLNSRYITSLKDFVKEHPKSPMSAFIIGNDMNNPNMPTETMIEALSYVDKSLENNSNIKAANKRMNDIKGTMVGYKANDFSQSTPDGKMVKLSDLKGKYVLVDFWASWCRPCRMENPNVVAAYNRYKDKGFTVLGVSMDSNKDQWMTAIKADNLTWQHVSDLKGWGNEVGILYGVKGIPQNFLVDKNGVIVAKNLRGPELDEKLAEIIK